MNECNQIEWRSFYSIFLTEKEPQFFKIKCPYVELSTYK